MTPEWITVKDAARLLDVTPRTVRRYIKRHEWESKLDTLQGSGVNYRFVKRSDVLDLVETNHRQSQALQAMTPSSDGAPAVAQEEYAETLERLASALEERNRIDRRRDLLALVVGLAIFGVLSWFTLQVLSKLP